MGHPGAPENQLMEHEPKLKKVYKYQYLYIVFIFLRNRRLGIKYDA